MKSAFGIGAHEMKNEQQLEVQMEPDIIPFECMECKNYKEITKFYFASNARCGASLQTHRIAFIVYVSEILPPHCNTFISLSKLLINASVQHVHML